MDFRKQYLLNCIKAFLLLNQQPKSLVKSTLFDDFIAADDRQTLILVYIIGKGFKMFKPAEQLPQESQLICIIKLFTNASQVNQSEIGQAFSVSLLPSDSLKQLVYQLDSFYVPYAEKTNPDLVDLLVDMKVSIDSSGLGENFDSDESNVVMNRLSDQFDFWKKLLQNASNPQMKNKAVYYINVYKDIEPQWKKISEVELAAIKQLIQVTFDALDKIWMNQYNYPQNRFVKLIHTFTDTLWNRLALYYNEVVPSSRSKLKQVSEIFNYWITTLKQYKDTIWTKSLRGDFSNPNALNRLKELDDVCLLLEQLNTVKKKLENIQNIEQIEKLFVNISPLNLSPSSSKQWQISKTRFYILIEGIQREISRFFKSNVISITKAKEKPLKALKQLSKWKGFLRRKNISKALSYQKQLILKTIASHIDSLKAQYESRSGQSIDPIAGKQSIKLTKNFSPYLSSIVWSKQFSQRIKKLYLFCEELFSDFPDFQQMKYQVQQTLSSMKQFQSEQFEDWKKNILKEIKDKKGEYSLQQSGRMMELDMKNAILKVNYSQKLVLLIREIRQLTQIGYKKEIPNQIIDACEIGKKFYKQALSLKKIANFYNNMSDEIMDSQKGMIVEELVHFEQCVKNVNLSVKTSKNKVDYITWDNPDYLESYISTLNSATNILLKQNSRIRKLHLKIVDMMIQLLNYDLIKQRQIWLEKLSNIKRTVEVACGDKDPKFCRKWKMHCDVQLYKILQTQYLRGIQELQTSINDIEVQIIIKNKVISFKPPIEELKDKYYREIKNYIQWPSKGFRGLLGNLDIYRKIAQKNSQYLGFIYAKAEKIFLDLEKHLSSLSPWSVIPYLSVNGIQKYLKSVKQWQDNIRFIRLKRKDLQKLPDYVKIQCFNISNLKFKTAADEYLQNLVENLMNALKNSLTEESDALEIFTRTSLKQLQKKPESLQQMQKTKNQYLQIKSKQKQMQLLYEQVELKNKWIRQATGLQQDTRVLQQLWEKFIQKIQDFDTLLAEQMKHLKNMIQGRTDELQNQIRKYQSRTVSIIMPTNRTEIPEFIQNLKSYKQDQTKLKQKIIILQKDCQQFELFVPNLTFKQIQWKNWQTLVQYMQEMSKYEQEFFLSMKNKLFQFQDLCTKWQQKIKPMQKNQQTLFISRQIELYKNIFPVLKQLSANIFQKDHWRIFFNFIKIDKDKSPDKLRFRDLINNAKLLETKANQIRQLILRAQGETTIRDAIQQLTVWSETTQFQLTEYENNNRKTPLIKEWKQLTSRVSDNLSLVSSLKQSKYANRFSDQIEKFQNNLSKIDLYLGKLNIIQRKWVYLEPIFIRGALPEQSERFEKLDNSFRNIMIKISQVKKVAPIASFEGLDASLDVIIQSQQRCQKALNDYLEDKRTRFPRFYFLGDEDLLQILGQSKNPLVIQMHLKKLFAAIHTVEFNKDNTQIAAICSNQMQVVVLDKKVQVSEVVQNWLIELQKYMFSTLQGLLKQYIASKKSLEINQYPSQILCLMEELRFSEQLQKAIVAKQLPKLQAQLKLDLQKLTSILPSLSGLASLKLKAIILDLIHHMSILTSLLQSQQAITINSYLYLKNFKLIPSQTKPILKLFDYSYQYTFQYQGNLPKLVHTPLTDKCFITLALAMSLGFGGNPYGPAGTGKTETVKSMAMFFGRMCLVFNCDEGLDYKSIARIFLGLVRCGAWGCFDEFNRLLQEQLSAISQQIQIIQNALKTQQKYLELIGKKVQVNANSAIFVTLNPAGKGYGGRSKLPDNLKQLFRPVAMSVPDNQLIAEVLLYSQGFKSAKILAQKIICLFTLSRQLLSQQQHYDWGLRALKTILTVSGRLIFEQRKKLNKQLSYEIQCQLLIKAIRINTLSKLTFPDMRKFKSLLNDIFPGIKSEDIVYQQLEAMVITVLKQMKLSTNPNQINKILQFYQATKQRMGVVIVGPSGCGKTTIWKVLKRAYQKMGLQLKTYLINPKSIPRTQLLGFMNNDTRQFNQGILTVSSRELVKNGGTNWIILDGDIDPEWIQSLNSVLDDNHLLTLPTGQRINFSNQTCFIFETDSLLYASPATVSRMGMIYLNNEDININNVIQKWLDNDKQGNSNTIKGFLDLLDIQKLLSLVQSSQIVKSTIVGRVSMMLSMLKGVSNKNTFIQRVYKGLFANSNNQIKPKALIQVFEKMKERNPLDQKTLSFYVQNNIFRCFTTLPVQYHIKEILQQPATIQTVAIQSNLSVLKSWVENCLPFIVVGPQGCGKGLLIRESFMQLKKTQKIMFATIHCNSQTNATQIINKLYQVCMKGNSGIGRILKPKQCSRLILYLKDINLPKPDKYQTIQLISFLQQLISHKGFYDPTSLQFVNIDEKIQIVCSMLPSTSIGRHELTPRFTAIARILSIQYPSNQDLVTIYSEYFRSMLQEKKLDLNYAKKLSVFLIQIYSSIQQKFSVDEYRHYSFTPKSLYNIFVELMRYDITNIQSLVEALVNEFSKNYRDKLVNNQAKSRFDIIVNNLVRQHFKLNSTMGNLYSLISGKLTKIKKQDYITMIKQAITLYEREYKQIHLVLLEETIQIINSIEKKLSSSGNILLTGISGIGRKTYLYLASLLLRIDIVSLPTVRDYSVRQFKKDLKLIIEESVNENKKIVLFMQDHHFIKSQFMEMINSLISSGQIPGLFATQEFQRMPCAQELRKEAYGMSLYQAFCKRVKDNIKIVLSLDYTKQSFNSVTASNPALYSCTIIWLDTLSSQSLQKLTLELLTKALPLLSKQIIEQMTKLITQIHKQIEEQYQTCPRDYYNLIQTFIKIYLNKVNSKTNQAKHLQSGLNKLQEAKQLVDQLSTEAVKKQKLLAVKQTQADQALNKISKAVQQATQRKQQTELLSKNLQTEQQKIHVKKKSVENQLSQVQPLIEQAKKAVSGINRKDIDELRSLPKPPQPIKHVLKTVLRMFGETESQWNAMKVFLKDRGVIDNILNFDPRKITADIRKDVETQIQKNSSSFEKATIYRASLAAGPLSDWVKATVKYSKVLESIKPLQTQMNTLMKALETSKKRVNQCEEKLAQLDKKVKELKQSFAKKISQAELLKNQLKKAQDILKSAKSLLTKLQDQKIRWQKDSQYIANQFKEFPINSLVTSAFISYLSDKDQAIREKLVKDWKNFCNLKSFNFLRFMITQSTQLKWRSQGLPSDSLSLENSVMVFNSNKVALLIDPNTQATQWLKKNNPKLESLNQQDPKFTNTLELALRFGKELLIQQLDNIEPILIPLIRKDLVQQASRSVVQIGDKQIDYNLTFKMILCTRNSGIDLQSNTKGLVSVINYSVTKSGLQSKLLSIIINHEKPELETKKIELLQNQERLKVSLDGLQKKLLQELAQSTGNILQNTSLIQSLNKTKVESNSIANSLKQSQVLNQKLDEERDIYRSLARKGSQIYLLINDLYKINNMYKFSLAYFTSLFIKCLQVNTQFKDRIQKLNYAAGNLYKISYNSISSSLFKSDRMTYALHLIKGVKPELFEPGEWQFFIQSNPPVLQVKVTLPKWAPFERKQIFNTFSVSLPKLSNSINFNDKEFETWYNDSAGQTSLPAACKKLSSFQKVLLIQIFKPEKLQSTLTSFILETFGLNSLAGTSHSFKSLHAESNQQIPILFIVSPGYDPSKELQQFCNEKIGKQHYKQLSMGGGQNDQAILMLKQAAEKGDWVCFKNLHLVTSWLPKLQKQFKSVKKHNNFRIFLTTQQHLRFPNILLETCFKVCYQAPPGIKKNLTRIYQSWQSVNSQLKSNLLFSLAYFHSIVQQRRTYIPQGWSKSYEFSYSDLKVSQQIIDNLIKEYDATKSLNFLTLYGIFEEGIYGGRIDNPFDLRVLRAYLKRYFNSAVLNGNKQICQGMMIPKNQKQIANFINKLPQIDSPQVYGLPLNIDQAVQRSNTSRTISSLKMMMSLSMQSIKFQKQKWNKLLSPKIQSWKHIYKHIKDSNYPVIKQSHLISQDPIQGFIFLQAAQALEMLQKINNSFNQIQSVVAGNGLLNTEIQNLCISLLRNQVPKKWETMWQGPEQPNEWIKSYGKKVSQLKKWVESAMGGNILNDEFDLSDLFHPQVFMNACRQRISRNLKTAIDELKMIVSFQQQKITTVNIIKIKGLLLQGCQLNNNKMLEQGNKNMQQFVNLPTLYLSFIQNKGKQPYSNNVEEFPIFSSTLREKLLFKIKLPVSGDISDRILGGVALLLRQV